MRVAFGVLFALALAAVTQPLSLRGRTQTLHIYGSTAGDPIIVSSGDGGWMHLGPEVAEFLGRRGYYVIGFDVRAYLSSFTSGTTTLDPREEPGDYAVLADVAIRATSKKPILIGVSEGAGLSVLAATDARVKGRIEGVIGLGLPDVNELGWRWQDAAIYFTHKVPNEPTFRASSVVAAMAPVPLAAIHSSTDEFVPIASVQAVMQAAGEPKQLWIVKASNHRFSDNRPEFEARLTEAIAWVHRNAPR